MLRVEHTAEEEFRASAVLGEELPAELAGP
jgi:hypothetical protein